MCTPTLYDNVQQRGHASSVAFPLETFLPDHTGLQLPLLFPIFVQSHLKRMLRRLAGVEMSIGIHKEFMELFEYRQTGPL